MEFQGMLWKRSKEISKEISKVTATALGSPYCPALPAIVANYIIVKRVGEQKQEVEREKHIHTSGCSCHTVTSLEARNTKTSCSWDTDGIFNFQMHTLQSPQLLLALFRPPIPPTGPPLGLTQRGLANQIQPWDKPTSTTWKTTAQGVWSF